MSDFERSLHGLSTCLGLWFFSIPTFIQNLPSVYKVQTINDIDADSDYFFGCLLFCKVKF